MERGIVRRSRVDSKEVDQGCYKFQLMSDWEFDEQTASSFLCDLLHLSDYCFLEFWRSEITFDS